MDRIVLKQQLTEFSVIYFGSSNVGHKFYIGNSGPKALALLALWVIRHCRSLGGRISPNLQLWCTWRQRWIDYVLRSKRSVVKVSYWWLKEINRTQIF